MGEDQRTTWWLYGCYVDMARALERECFDYIMIEHTRMVSEANGDSAGAALKYVLQVPKNDPARSPR